MNYEQPPGESSPESILEHNYQMLERDMEMLLMKESMGGNAGAVEIDGTRYACVGANGYADPHTGKIILFENVQHVPKSIQESSAEFTMKAAFRYPTGFFRIVECRYRNTSSEGGTGMDISDAGRRSIDAAIERYNKERALDS